MNMQRLRILSHAPRCLLPQQSRTVSSWTEPAAARHLRRLYWPSSKAPNPRLTACDNSSSGPIGKNLIKRFSASQYQLGAASRSKAIWHGQVLACGDPSRTNMEDLLTQIHPLYPNIGSSEAASAVVLVTKQFASLLAVDDGFLQGILQKLWSAHSEQQDAEVEISVLAAAVDGIPSSDKGSSNTEGITICASDRFSLVETTTDTADTTPELHTRALKLDEQPPTISVRILNDEATENSVLELMLPIASTLFHTNRPSTISLSRWSFSKGHATKRIEGLKRSGNYVMKLPMANPRPSLRSDLPLVQLTGPRVIKSAMGNVIRELEETPQSIDPSKLGEVVGREGGGVTSASRELEGAVAALIAMPGKLSVPVQVWALVIPEELTSSSAFAALTRSTDMALENINSGSHSDGSASALHNLIFGGASLRRVLSGGGGWGNKAGLLSLDPHSDYAQRSSDELFDLDGTDPMSFLRGTAAPGDRIVFYALVDTNNTNSSRSALEFGVIPSTIDDLPNSAAMSSSGQVKIQHIPDRFGFLSELGMSVSKDDDTTDAVVRSRIDAPYSNIRIDLDVE